MFKKLDQKVEKSKTRKLRVNSTSKVKSFKAQKKSNGDKIRRMLAAMEQQVNQTANQAEGAAKVGPDSEQFFSSGRTGRRNALPDILGDHAHVTSSDLPARLQALTTTEPNKISLPEDQAGPSRQMPEQN